MTGSLVGAAKASSYTTGTTLTPAYNQPPSAGNLLLMGVAVATVSGTTLTCTTPTGWTAGPSGLAYNATYNVYDYVFLFWKVASGGDAAPAITVNTTFINVNVIVEEWSGLSAHDANSTVGTLTTRALSGNCDSGPLTTAGASEFIWSFFGANTGGVAPVLTWGGGSTSDSQFLSGIATATATQTAATAGTYTPTLAFTDSNYMYAGATASMAFTGGPPNASTLNNPATGTTIDLGVTQRFGWAFSSPVGGDSQSKFDLQYRLGTGSWTTVTQAIPNSFWDAAPGTFTAGSYEWQVRTYGSTGLVGPWSASNFFTAGSSPGVPSITAPTSGSTVVSSATVTWSVPTQTDYQIRKMDDVAGAAGTTVYYDSGDVVDSSTRSVTVAFPVNVRWEHIQVRVKAAGLWSAWADCRVYVSWTPPMVPTIVVTTDPTTATMRVAITNPTSTGGAPTAAYNDVYVSSPLDAEYRAASLVAPNSTWIWWTPGAGRAYTIRAVAVGTNGTTATSVDMVVIDGGAPTFDPGITIDGGTP